MWSCGWDFHKPSQDLVNAYKTQDGLPMFDSYDDSDAYPVNGVQSAQKWDPRLFHTVGMPSFPYKYEDSYMMTMQNSRTPNTYGYFTSLKEVPQRSAGETFEGSWQAFATNDYVFRYTDVMLMRAEALIEPWSAGRGPAQSSTTSVSVPPTQSTSISVMPRITVRSLSTHHPTSLIRIKPVYAYVGNAVLKWLWRAADTLTSVVGVWLQLS